MLGARSLVAVFCEAETGPLAPLGLVVEVDVVLCDVVAEVRDRRVAGDRVAVVSACAWPTGGFL
jgi:hypothetical protein